MKYTRKSFSVPVQTVQDHPKSANLAKIFGRSFNLKTIKSFLKEGALAEIKLRFGEKGRVVATRGGFSVHVLTEGNEELVANVIAVKFLAWQDQQVDF